MKYELKEGKFGYYFVDNEGNHNLGLQDVLDRLNYYEETLVRLNERLDKLINLKKEGGR